MGLISSQRAAVQWERKGCHCLLIKGRHKFVILLGVPMGHPVYRVKKSLLRYRLTKSLLESVVYAGWWTRQRRWWYVGLKVPDEIGGDAGGAIMLSNRLIDSMAGFTAQEQMVLPIRWETVLPKR